MRQITPNTFRLFSTVMATAMLCFLSAAAPAAPVHMGAPGFTGYLDELHLHPRALSQGELLVRYQSLPNQSPDQPFAPEPVTAGQITGPLNTAITFKFQAFDQDGDQLKYRIDWGDGSAVQETAYAPAGSIVQVPHSWTTQGTYSVKVQAVQNVNGTETASSWSPAYKISLAAALGAQQEGPILFGATVLKGQTSQYKMTLTAGEPLAGRSATAQHKARFGYPGPKTGSSNASGVFLGKEAVGGAHVPSPQKTPVANFADLAGNSSQDVDAIAQGLRQHGYAAVRKDLNGNYQVLSGRWMKFDAEQRIVKIIAQDGTVTDHQYDHTGQRVKRTVTPSGGSPTTTIYVGDLWETAGGIITKYIFAGGQRIAQRTGAKGK